MEKYLQIEKLDKNDRMIFLSRNHAYILLPIDEIWLKYADKALEYFIDDALINDLEVGTQLKFTIIESDITLEEYNKKYEKNKY